MINIVLEALPKIREKFYSSDEIKKRICSCFEKKVKDECLKTNFNDFHKTGPTRCQLEGTC